MSDPRPATTVPAGKGGLLGTCAAIGADFGFNPEYLRVLLVATMLWNAAAVVAAYLGMSAVVAISRWLVPARAPAAAAVRPLPVCEAEPAAPDYAEAA